MAGTNLYKIGIRYKTNLIKKNGIGIVDMHFGGDYERGKNL